MVPLTPANAVIGKVSMVVVKVAVTVVSLSMVTVAFRGSTLSGVAPHQLRKW